MDGNSCYHQGNRVRGHQQSAILIRVIFGGCDLEAENKNGARDARRFSALFRNRVLLCVSYPAASPPRLVPLFRPFLYVGGLDSDPDDYSKNFSRCATANPGSTSAGPTASPKSVRRIFDSNLERTISIRSLPDNYRQFRMATRYSCRGLPPGIYRAFFTIALYRHQAPISAIGAT